MQPCQRILDRGILMDDRPQRGGHARGIVRLPDVATDGGADGAGLQRRTAAWRACRCGIALRSTEYNDWHVAAGYDLLKTCHIGNLDPVGAQLCGDTGRYA